MPYSKLKLRLQILLFTLSRTVINTSYRMVYPFLPVFARGLDVPISSLAIAFSIRSFLGVFGPFLATLADTHDRKTGMLLGLGFFTIGSGVVGIWANYWGFILGTSLVLLGNGVFIPSMNAFLGDRVPFEKRGRVLAITELSWAVAFILGIPIVRVLLESYHWATPFIAFTGIGLALFVIFTLVLPTRRVIQSTENTLWGNLWRVISTWPALAGLLSGVLSTGANETINLIFGVWIEDQFGLDYSALTATAVVIGVSELGGEVITGLWLDGVGKRRMIWIALGLNSLCALFLPAAGGSVGRAMLGLAFFYITFEIILVSMLTLMSEVLSKARATMIAATVAGFSLGRMLGDLIAPGIYGIGFWASCVTVVGLNMLAAVLLTQVRLSANGKVKAI